MKIFYLIIVLVCIITGWLIVNIMPLNNQFKPFSSIDRIANSFEEYNIKRFR